MTITSWSNVERRVEPTTLHVHCDTVPGLSAEEVVGLTAAVMDWVSLGIAATTNRARFVHLGVETSMIRQDPTSSERRVAGVHYDGIGRESWRVFPPHAFLSLVREEVLHVSRFSYSNPIEAYLQAWISEKEANALVAFLKLLLLAGPARRYLNAAAERERLKAIGEEATLEMTIDERFDLIERAQVATKIEKEKLKQEKIRTETARRALARDIRVGQNRANAGVDWSEKNALEFADNTRLLGSVDAAQIFGIEVEVVKENQGS